MKSVEHYWYQPNFLVWLLLPISWLFCAVAVTRRKLYQLRFKKSFPADVPVVVIGNIVAGGSGKTPLLISVCEYIKQKGFKPGVVSRGYGGSVVGVKQVEQSDSAELVGDEPLMIHQRTEVPVVVGADRVAAVNYLLEHNQCDIVLSDDGLQHYRMQRDIEIAVVDANRRFGNGFCLPAGPLREPVSRLNEVDMVVYSGADAHAEYSAYTLKVVDLYHLGSGEQDSVLSLDGKTAHVVAGIGDPERFFTQMRDYRVNVIEHAFADHHVYIQDDFSGWDNDYIIMTEKDAVKCRNLALPDAWVIRVEAEFTRALTSELDLTLQPLLKRSSGQ